MATAFTSHLVRSWPKWVTLDDYSTQATVPALLTPTKPYDKSALLLVIALMGVVLTQPDFFCSLLDAPMRFSAFFFLA
ncbi:MAG: hypothetical protein H6656_15935 [Ardenticatenaceae bacterium]|nr:hypothetical protein [Ardenticatenaceae bacterium]